MPHDKDNKVSDQQRKFCDEYLIDFNATRAAKAAGYSKETATEQASRLLTNVKVIEYLGEKQKRLSIKHDLTLDTVVNEYKKIAFLDIRKCFDDNGELIPLHELDDNTAGAIAGMEVNEERTVVEGETITTGRTKKIKIFRK